MNKALIAFGANLGKPVDAFSEALADLDGVSAVSGVWQSPAWPPGSSAPDYLNMAAIVKTPDEPAEVLARLHDIERRAGRERGVRNASRTLDLDLIGLGQRVETRAALTLPHPRMEGRGFVLLPLSQIAADWRHPVSGLTVMEMLSRLPLAEVAPMRYLGRVVALPGDSH